MEQFRTHIAKDQVKIKYVTIIFAIAHLSFVAKVIRNLVSMVMGVCAVVAGERTA